MTLIEIILILVIHWFADFVLQTQWITDNQDRDMDALLGHTVTYSLVWLCVGVLYSMSLEGQAEQLYAMFLFPLATWAFHTIVDYFSTQRMNELFKRGNMRNFYVVFGLDQLIHILQLFTLYYLMFK
jgi:hypothetical protein